MKSFKEYLAEVDFNMFQKTDFSYGHPKGSTVRINEPGHPNHGLEGRVLSQNGHSHGVEIGNRVSWHNTKNLKQVK